MKARNGLSGFNEDVTLSDEIERIKTIDELLAGHPIHRDNRLIMSKQFWDEPATRLFETLENLKLCPIRLLRTVALSNDLTSLCFP